MSKCKALQGLLTSGDKAEGLAAFLEKQPPNFRNRQGFDRRLAIDSHIQWI